MSSDSDDYEEDFRMSEEYKLWQKESDQLDEEFKSTLEELENNWFKQSARLSSFLVSPIHDSAAKGNLEYLIDLIKQNNNDINARDSVGNTPLHWASGSGRTNVIEWLIKNNADINAVNLLGDTALHKAVWRGYKDAVELLLEAGINKEIVNKQGHKAIDLVKDVDIGALIQSYDEIPDDVDINELYELSGFSSSSEDSEHENYISSGDN